MKLFVFFGLPGAGKTFAAQAAEKYFDYHIYDGDINLTEEMLNAIKNQSVITDAMRDIFFARLIQSTKKLSQKYDKLIIHQTFIKEKYRKQFFSEIPQAKFVLIQTDTSLRENRLKMRKYFPLDEAYARNMVNLFDKALLKHEIIQNNNDGDEAIKEQLQKILV
jgi:gluconate kinase